MDIDQKFASGDLDFKAMVYVLTQDYPEVFWYLVDRTKHIIPCNQPEVAKIIPDSVDREFVKLECLKLLELHKRSDAVQLIVTSGENTFEANKTIDLYSGNIVPNWNVFTQGLSLENFNKILVMLSRKEKVEAIKFFREVTGYGKLKDAHDYITALEEQIKKEEIKKFEESCFQISRRGDHAQAVKTYKEKMGCSMEMAIDEIRRICRLRFTIPKSLTPEEIKRLDEMLLSHMNNGASGFSMAKDLYQEKTGQSHEAASNYCNKLWEKYHGKTPAEELKEKCIELLKSGDKVAATKLYKDQGGVDLYDAKKIVEGFEIELNKSPVRLPWKQEIVDLIRGGNTDGAIFEYMKHENVARVVAEKIIVHAAARMAKNIEIGYELKKDLDPQRKEIIRLIDIGDKNAAIELYMKLENNTDKLFASRIIDEIERRGKLY